MPELEKSKLDYLRAGRPVPGEDSKLPEVKINIIESRVDQVEQLANKLKKSPLDIIRHGTPSVNGKSDNEVSSKL